MKILVRETKENVCNYVWKEISKTYPFCSSDYHTTDGLYYECGKIIKISRDYRKLGYIQCTYCGAVIKRGKEEQHYAESEAKANCAKCEFLKLEPTGKPKIVLCNGQAICKSVNVPYCTRKSRYRATPIEGIDRLNTCQFYQCRRNGNFNDLSDENDFLFDHPDPYTVLLTENAVLNNNWTFMRQDTTGRKYSTKNGKLIAHFDLNGVLMFFSVRFHNNVYDFVYLDRYDKFMTYSGPAREFTWNAMSERTITSYTNAIRKLYK